jgi:hypothetical protein
MKKWILGMAGATTALALIVPTQAMASDVFEPIDETVNATVDVMPGFKVKAPKGYGNLETYCADAQLETTGLLDDAIDVAVASYTQSTALATVDPTGFDAFKKSKAAITTATNTVTVRQLVVKDAAGNDSQVLCKLKDRASIEQAFGTAVFAENTEQSECNAINISVLRDAFTTLPTPRNKAAKAMQKTVIDAATNQLGGNGWAVTNFATITNDGTLTHLRSNQLVTPNDPNTVLPNATVDALNAQFGRFLPAPLPYGTTQQALISMRLLDAGILGSQYCTTPTVTAVQAALTA